MGRRMPSAEWIFGARTVKEWVWYEGVDEARIIQSFAKKRQKHEEQKKAKYTGLWSRNLEEEKNIGPSNKENNNRVKDQTRGATYNSN